VHRSLTWRCAAALAVVAILAAVPATVSAGGITCTFTTAAVPFGSYNVLATSPTYGTGSVSGHCSTNDPVTIALSAGNSGSTSQRYMKSASSATLNYQSLPNLGVRVDLGHRDIRRHHDLRNGPANVDHLRHGTRAARRQRRLVFGLCRRDDQLLTPLLTRLPAVLNAAPNRSGDPCWRAVNERVPVQRPPLTIDSLFRGC